LEYKSSDTVSQRCLVKKIISVVKINFSIFLSTGSGVAATEMIVSF
jgi:hypothetical protein